MGLGSPAPSKPMCSLHLRCMKEGQAGVARLVRLYSAGTRSCSRATGCLSFTCTTKVESAAVATAAGHAGRSTHLRQQAPGVTPLVSHTARDSAHTRTCERRLHGPGGAPEAACQLRLPLFWVSFGFRVIKSQTPKPLGLRLRLPRLMVTVSAENERAFALFTLWGGLAVRKREKRCRNGFPHDKMGLAPQPAVRFASDLRRCKALA